MQLHTWPADELILDQEDIHLISLKQHPWQIAMAKEDGGLPRADWFALPQPDMLGLQHATLHYRKGAGRYGKGYATAQYHIAQNDPWFWCHFLGDPVMPGAQGQDAFTQLGGIWAAGSCAISGRGRALAGSFTYEGQILPTSSTIYFQLDVIRFLKKKKVVFFDGYLAVDQPDNVIYRFGEHKVGFFTREELGLSDADPGTYYHPQWDTVKTNTLTWIQQAIDYYRTKEEHDQQP